MSYAMSGREMTSPQKWLKILKFIQTKIAWLQEESLPDS